MQFLVDPEIPPEKEEFQICKIIGEKIVVTSLIFMGAPSQTGKELLRFLINSESSCSVTGITENNVRLPNFGCISSSTSFLS